MGKNVVITGFNKTTANEENFSGVYARRFVKKPYRGYKFISSVIDVNTSDFVELMENYAYKQHANLIIMCEVKNTKKVRIETKANNKNFQDTDSSITKHALPMVFEAFKNSFSTIIPMDKLKKIKNSSLYPAIISNNAGIGVSNKLYYYVLKRTHEMFDSLQSILIHMPQEEFEYEDYVDLIHNIIDILIDG